MGELQERRTGSVKATANMFGERVSAFKKPPQIPKTSSRTRETRTESKLKGSRDFEPDESELIDAKNKANDLNLKIEQSNSRAKAQMEYLEKLKETRRGEGDWGTRSKNHQCEEVMKELEDLKEELRKLKVGMASLMEEKRRAEKEIDESNLKAKSCSSSVEAIKKEIEEINEEHVLVELARIEAVKEYEAIESNRKDEAEKHSAVMEESRTKIDLLNQETNAAKELETKLATTTSDVNMLNELKQVKEMGNMMEGEGKEESDDPNLLYSITKEVESAKKELASLREESFKFMASMDIIRTELRNLSAETARARKREEKADFTIQNLNAKLLRGKDKLEAATLAEEKAKSIVANLSRTLEQLKTETETAKKEKILIDEETANIKAEINKTESEIDLSEERLQVAFEELESIKSSEAKALEELQKLIENTMRNRAAASQRGSKITISKFEYEYLRGRAAGAEEIADKKVAAAQAWIEALKASEKEILIKTEMAKKENRELRIEEELQMNRIEESLPAKNRAESESENLWQKYEGKTAASSAKSTYRNGKTTPSRRGKPRKSASPSVRGTPRSASFSVRRKPKPMPNLAKFFSGKSSDGNM